MKADKFDI